MRVKISGLGTVFHRPDAGPETDCGKKWERRIVRGFFGGLLGELCRAF